MADDLPNIAPSSATETAPDPAAVVKDQALTQLARDEDVTNYAAERDAQDRENRGEEVEPTADRVNRIRDAMERARKDTAQARQDAPNELDQQLSEAEQQWQETQQQEATFEQERELARAEGKFMATAEELKAVNPTAHQEITSALGTLDVMMQPEQIDVLKKAVTRGNPRESMLVLHRLTQPSPNGDGSVTTPEMKLQYLASLPPQQLEAVLDQSRTYLQLEQSISQQFAARYANQPRRVTQAPPVMTHPRGGAAPPRDVASLARKDNASDYIKMRMAQEKRARDG